MNAGHIYGCDVPAHRTCHTVFTVPRSQSLQCTASTYVHNTSVHVCGACGCVRDVYAIWMQGIYVDATCRHIEHAARCSQCHGHSHCSARRARTCTICRCMCAMRAGACTMRVCDTDARHIRGCDVPAHRTCRTVLTVPRSQSLQYTASMCTMCRCLCVARACGSAWHYYHHYHHHPRTSQGLEQAAHPPQ
jgi:hypothetical protein